MPDFIVQENPEVSPKACYFCGTHAGPWLNTMVFDPTGRIILICVPTETRESGCVGAMVNLIGGLTPTAAGDVKAELKWALEQKDEFEERLEAFRDQVAAVTA